MKYDDLLKMRTEPMVVKYKHKQYKTDKISQQAFIYNKLKKFSDNAKTVYVNPSINSDSVYGMVTFKGKIGVFLFSIKNHVSRGDSVNVEYFYKDFTNIVELMNKIKEDINCAYKEGSHCSTTRITAVDYEALQTIASYRLVLRKNLDGDITGFYLKDINGVILSSKPRFLSTKLVKDLYQKKLLREILNRRNIEELVVSKLGFLALERNKYRYESKYKLAYC